MSRKVTLSEFVEAFSKWGENVSSECWILKDLSLDGDELDWAICDIEANKKWVFDWECDLSQYIPRFAYWGLAKSGFADLKLRELYAFSRAVVTDD